MMILHFLWAYHDILTKHDMVLLSVANNNKVHISPKYIKFIRKIMLSYSKVHYGTCSLCITEVLFCSAFSDVLDLFLPFVVIN